MSCTTPQSAQIGLMCNNDITQFYLPPTHEPYLPLIPSRKASPPLGWYQLVLLGEQRHIGVRNMPRVFTPCARLRLEPTTSWSQVQQSTDGATTPPKHPCVCCCTRYPQIVIDTVQPKLLFCNLCTITVHSHLAMKMFGILTVSSASEYQYR